MSWYKALSNKFCPHFGGKHYDGKLNDRSLLDATLICSLASKQASSAKDETARFWSYKALAIMLIAYLPYATKSTLICASRLLASLSTSLVKMNSRHSNETSSGSSYESKQPVLYAITILFMVLETTAVILRFVSRRIGKVSWSRDDALIIASWAMTITFNVTILVDVRYGGTGLHMARIMETDPSMSVYFSQDILPVGITWILSVALSKLTVLSLYLSLFAIKRVTRYICYATGAIIILNCLGGISACFGVCVPLKALWDTGVAGHCFNLNMLLRWIRLPHILSDVIMLILPISHIIKLQTTRRIKFGLLISFLFGSVGFIFGLICWVQYFATDAIADKTWSAVNIFIWSILEAGMYLIAACLLAYHPIVSLIWKQVRKHFTGMSRTKSEPGSTRDYEMGLGSHDQIPDGRAFVPLSDKEEYIGLVTVAKVKQGQRGETVRSMN